jgi:spore maturation protein CgeB
VSRPIDLVVLGLTITSSWGNGHATTYRALLKGFANLGHRITFLERDVPWYGPHRDLLSIPGVTVELYGSLDDLAARFSERVARADAVMLGSYVPDGLEAASFVLRTARGVCVFYDIDTPVTLARLRAGEPSYIDLESVARFDAYLSFSGGLALEQLESDFGARLALPLYCSVDPEHYAPASGEPRWDLGYLGTYSEDRQATLERLLNEPARQSPARRFVVAGACYPEIDWPANVERVEHVAPAGHSAFYGSQRFTLNVTRRDMIEMGHSPSVRLFEAAACGVPIISDYWVGLEDFFELDSEILIASEPEEVLSFLDRISEPERRAIAARARERVLAEHTAYRRARRLERYVRALQAKVGESLRQTRKFTVRPLLRKGA